MGYDIPADHHGPLPPKEKVQNEPLPKPINKTRLNKWREHLFTLESIYHLGALESNQIAHSALGRAMEFFQEQEQRLKHEESKVHRREGSE